MQHLVVSHTYGVCDVPPGSDPAEQRKKMDSDPDSSSTTACVWWRNPQPRVPAPNNGNHTKGEREGEREVSKEMGCREGEPSSTIYSTKGGAPCRTSPRWDYSHHAYGRGSGRPPCGQVAHGASLLWGKNLSLNGPNMAH